MPRSPRPERAPRPPPSPPANAPRPPPTPRGWRARSGGRTPRLLCAGANLPESLRYHDLRHGAASLLLSQSVPVPVVSRYLGHADPSVTMRVYAHMIDGTSGMAASGMDDASRIEACPDTDDCPEWSWRKCGPLVKYCVPVTVVVTFSRRWCRKVGSPMHGRHDRLVILRPLGLGHAPSRG